MYKRVLEKELKRVARQYPVVTLTGPRQSGKTTLVRTCFRKHQYASLEEPDVREFALEDPRGFLNQFSGPVVLDEVRRVPDLFSYIHQAERIACPTKQPAYSLLVAVAASMISKANSSRSPAF